jgi:hypothetical protein
MKPLALFLAVLALYLSSAAAPVAEPELPSYVGSSTCIDCHADQAKAWRDSHHALAWTQPDRMTVLGDFSDTTFEHKGVTSTFSHGGREFFVETEGADGESMRFKVVGVAGIAPLQQYLVETEPGRLQALDVAWDVAARRWYHLYPDADLPPADGLHWTGPYKTWNARCAECHATGYRKNYDPGSRRYASTQAEIGVGCEACHGPGEAHLSWAREPASYDPAPWSSVTQSGLTVEFNAGESEIEIQQCAGCHSRREAFSDGNPLPGTPFHDAYRLALLREGLYHPDGSIHDEVYVYGSFLQSKMYARGVRCTDCHDPHSAGSEPPPVAICTTCHSPTGNPRFPSLKPAEYDSPTHHFHPAGSEAAQCVSCHMIERVYMGIDSRRDHSFRIPRPDLSAETDAPNACNDCHADRDAQWAAAEIAKRYPGRERRSADFSRIFAAARRDPEGLADSLLGIARHAELPAIIRATALDQLRPIADEHTASAAALVLADAEALVREAAVGVQRAALVTDRKNRLGPALFDPVRAVRIAAARELVDMRPDALPPGTAPRLGVAMREWQATLLAKADFPETQMAIGGVALALRNPAAGTRAFREAVVMDPQLVEGWIMIARISAALGDIEGAAASIDAGLAANPGNGALMQLHREIASVRQQ